MRTCKFFFVDSSSVSAGSSFKFCPEDGGRRFLQNVGNHYEFTCCYNSKDHNHIRISVRFRLFKMCHLLRYLRKYNQS
jgi:hypothetical protein